MKKSQVAIFLSVVLTLYTLINYYIFAHVSWLLPSSSVFAVLFQILFLTLILMYPLGRFSERVLKWRISKYFIWIGAFYLAAMVYYFLFFLLLDAVRIADLLVQFSVGAPTLFDPTTRSYILFIASGIIIASVIIGHLNSRFIRTRTLEITLPKFHVAHDSLKIVLLSDLHLGTLIGNGRLRKMVEKINRVEPELVLIAGDIVDEDIAPVSENNMAAELRRIRAPLGVFAVTGNHEYFSGAEHAIAYVSRGKVRVLQDAAFPVTEGLYLIGRRDRIAERFGEKRLPLSEIMKNIPADAVTILLDHQPLGLHEAREQGIHLQLSGHTHHGQMFPFNLITRRVYEISWGYRKKGNTHYYVSCGVGTWGPPVRIGNRPEIVNILLKFAEDSV